MWQLSFQKSFARLSIHFFNNKIAPQNTTGAAPDFDEASPLQNVAVNSHLAVGPHVFFDVHD